MANPNRVTLSRGATRSRREVGRGFRQFGSCYGAWGVPLNVLTTSECAVRNSRMLTSAHARESICESAGPGAWQIHAWQIGDRRCPDTHSALKRCCGEIRGGGATGHCECFRPFAAVRLGACTRHSAAVKRGNGRGEPGGRLWDSEYSFSAQVGPSLARRCPLGACL